MDPLSNAFSLLEVDDSGDMEQTMVADKSAKKKKKGVSSDGLADHKLENTCQQGSSMVADDYKMPLVWIDLEMTGLNIEIDRILEIACIITNGSLTKSIEAAYPADGVIWLGDQRSNSLIMGHNFIDILLGPYPMFVYADTRAAVLLVGLFLKTENGPDIVIHQTKECLDEMGEWCQEHHAASGLTENVIKSSVTEREAEKQVIEFVKKNVGTSTPLLAGNSIYVDFLYLKKYMPELAGLFSHVLVDVSSIKALCIRWYPKDNKKAPRKGNKHRAMDDIKESIAELKYFKGSIFKSKK